MSLLHLSISIQCLFNTIASLEIESISLLHHYNDYISQDDSMSLLHSLHLLISIQYLYYIIIMITSLKMIQCLYYIHYISEDDSMSLLHHYISQDDSMSLLHLLRLLQFKVVYIDLILSSFNQ